MNLPALGMCKRRTALHYSVTTNSKSSCLDVLVPRVHRRSVYLSNLLWDPDGLCLDLFSVSSLRPLFRHYFHSGNPL